MYVNRILVPHWLYSFPPCLCATTRVHFVLPDYKFHPQRYHCYALKKERLKIGGRPSITPDTNAFPYWNQLADSSTNSNGIWSAPLPSSLVRFAALHDHSKKNFTFYLGREGTDPRSIQSLTSIFLQTLASYATRHQLG